jgi:hypothetical protein
MVVTRNWARKGFRRCWSKEEKFQLYRWSKFRKSFVQYRTIHVKSYQDPIWIKEPGMAIQDCNSRHTRSIHRRIVVHGQPRAKILDSIQKITKSKKGWGKTGYMAQVAERLPSKHEDLSSNHSTTKKKKKKVVSKCGVHTSSIKIHLGTCQAPCQIYWIRNARGKSQQCALR